MSRKALGRGLSALIPVNESQPQAADVAAVSPCEIPVSEIQGNPYQPREAFDSVRLDDLVRSIKETGLIQPIVVRQSPDGGGGYQLIAGERRLRAAKKAGFQMIPAIVRRASKREMLEFALIENIHREDLNPIDEARAYRRMTLEFDLTQEEVATKVGKDRSTVANALRLLNLPDAVQQHVSRGTLTTGHARCLLALESQSEQESLAEEIIRKSLSVRQTEEISARKRRRASHRRLRAHPALAAWEDRLRRVYGTQVRIRGGTARGRIEISYFSEDDLERILEVTGVLTQ